MDRYSMISYAIKNKNLCLKLWLINLKWRVFQTLQLVEATQCLYYCGGYTAYSAAIHLLKTKRYSVFF